MNNKIIATGNKPDSNQVQKHVNHILEIAGAVKVRTSTVRALTGYNTAWDKVVFKDINDKFMTFHPNGGDKIASLTTTNENEENAKEVLLNLWPKACFRSRRSKKRQPAILKAMTYLTDLANDTATVHLVPETIKCLAKAGRDDLSNIGRTNLLKDKRIRLPAAVLAKLKIRPTIKAQSSKEEAPLSSDGLEATPKVFSSAEREVLNIINTVRRNGTRISALTTITAMADQGKVDLVRDVLVGLAKLNMVSYVTRAIDFLLHKGYNKVFFEKLVVEILYRFVEAEETRELESGTMKSIFTPLISTIRPHYPSMVTAIQYYLKQLGTPLSQDELDAKPPAPDEVPQSRESTRRGRPSRDPDDESIDAF